MAFNGKKKGGYDARSLQLFTNCYIPDTSMSAGGKAAKKATAAAKASPPSRDNRDDVAKDWASSS